MKNTENLTENFEDVYKEVAIKIHGNYVEYVSLENKLKELKKGGSLTYDHLLYISDKENWPLFSKWYQWPEKDQIVEGLTQTQDLFVDLKNYKNLPLGEQEELDRTLFNTLFKIIKNIELVSIILRFVDSDNYGIYSPPVAYLLDSPRGVSYVNEYINYISTLREHKDNFGLDKVAHVDMFIWTLVKVQEYHLAEFGNMHVEEIQSDIKGKKEDDLISKILPKKFNGKSNLYMAAYFYRLNLYDLAAKNAGIAFEEVINQKCKQYKIHNEYDGFAKGERMDLSKKIWSLLKTLGKLEYEYNLKWVRKLRNYASHPTGYNFKKADILKMISMTLKIKNW